MTRERTVKPKLPWYNNSIHTERRVRRRLERKWKKSNSAFDEQAYRSQKEHVNKLITDSKIMYFSDKCTNCNIKDMYAIINVLLNKTAQVLPDCDSNTKLADNFLSSFKDKVDTIRSNVSSHPDTNVIVPKQTSTVFCMPEFEQLTCDAVKQIIMRLSNKSCSLDTLQSWLVKNNLSTLLPVITKIVNASLSSGIFPSNLKHSVITPVLKKSSLDRNDLKSYRPVANVPFLSKVYREGGNMSSD